MTGWLAGLTLAKVGGTIIWGGSCFEAAVIEACTSRAAPSMLRAGSNCMVTSDCPSVLAEVICVSPEIVANCFSRGMETAEAMVSAEAPGKVLVTWMVGKSTLGRLLIGRD